MLQRHAASSFIPGFASLLFSPSSRPIFTPVSSVWIQFALKFTALLLGFTATFTSLSPHPPFPLLLDVALLYAELGKSDEMRAADISCVGAC